MRDTANTGASPPHHPRPASAACLGGLPPARSRPLSAVSATSEALQEAQHEALQEAQHEAQRLAASRVHEWRAHQLQRLQEENRQQPVPWFKERAGMAAARRVKLWKREVLERKSPPRTLTTATGTPPEGVHAGYAGAGELPAEATLHARMSEYNGLVLRLQRFAVVAADSDLTALAGLVEARSLFADLICSLRIAMTKVVEAVQSSAIEQSEGAWLNLNLPTLKRAFPDPPTGSQDGGDAHAPGTRTGDSRLARPAHERRLSREPSRRLSKQSSSHVVLQALRNPSSATPAGFAAYSAARHNAVTCQLVDRVSSFLPLPVGSGDPLLLKWFDEHAHVWVCEEAMRPHKVSRAVQYGATDRNRMEAAQTYILAALDNRRQRLESDTTQSLPVFEQLRRALVSNLARSVNLFREMDVDQSGEIDKSEFHKFLGLLGLEATPEQSAELFSALDEDGSGTIEFSELKARLQNGAAPSLAGSARIGGGLPPATQVLPGAQRAPPAPQRRPGSAAARAQSSPPPRALRLARPASAAALCGSASRPSSATSSSAAPSSHTRCTSRPGSAATTMTTGTGASPSYRGRGRSTAASVTTDATSLMPSLPPPLDPAEEARRKAEARAKQLRAGLEILIYGTSDAYAAALDRLNTKLSEDARIRRETVHANMLLATGVEMDDETRLRFSARRIQRIYRKRWARRNDQLKATGERIVTDAIVGLQRSSAAIVQHRLLSKRRQTEHAALTERLAAYRILSFFRSEAYAKAHAARVASCVIMQTKGRRYLAWRRVKRRLAQRQDDRVSLMLAMTNVRDAENKAGQLQGAYRIYRQRAKALHSSYHSQQAHIAVMHHVEAAESPEAAALLEVAAAAERVALFARRQLAIVHGVSQGAAEGSSRPPPMDGPTARRTEEKLRDNLAAAVTAAASPPPVTASLWVQRDRPYRDGHAHVARGNLAVPARISRDHRGCGCESCHQEPCHERHMARRPLRSGQLAVGPERGSLSKHLLGQSLCLLAKLRARLLGARLLR